MDCGGNALLKQAIDDVLARYSPYSKEWEALSIALNGTSEILKIDGEGRVVLTEMVKTTACISSEVTFVGQGIQVPDLGARPVPRASRRGQASICARSGNT